MSDFYLENVGGGWRGEERKGIHFTDFLYRE
jgi:hypothetical protein